jgi:hypothetical protein
VPEGRGPRLSRQVKANLRFSDLKTLPPQTPLTTGRAIPGLAGRVSALRHRARRDLSGDRPRSADHPSHLFSATATSRAGLPLRPQLHTSISRHSDWRPITKTSTLPSSAAEPGRSLCSAADEVFPSCRAQKARSRDGQRTHSTEPTPTSGPRMSRQPQHEEHYTNNNNSNNNYCSCCYYYYYYQ